MIASARHPIRARLALTLIVAASSWAGLLLAAPAIASDPASSVASTRAMALVYMFGGAVCHQKPERSFHIGRAQMPVCARCAGLYFSAPFGALLAFAPFSARIARRRGIRGPLLVAALPTAATWLLEVAGLFAPSLWLRTISAVPLGLAVSWIVTHALLSGEVN